MIVLRAHSYSFVDAIRNELSILPESWKESIEHVPWILYHDDLCPVWTGLMKGERVSWDGRKYSEGSAWYCPFPADKNWRHQPHIFLKPKSLRSVVHEAAHAIEVSMNIPTAELFEPERALYPYMAGNKSEFFACAVDAFLRRPTIGPRNINDLWKSGAEIYNYLVEISQ